MYGKREELVDRRGGKRIFKSRKEWTRAIVNSTIWEEIVVKSSVVPQRSCKIMGQKKD